MDFMSWMHHNWSLDISYSPSGELGFELGFGLRVWDIEARKTTALL